VQHLPAGDAVDRRRPSRSVPPARGDRLDGHGQ
jgi:hypothetical protein